jgi:hypothetical protein
MRVTLESFLLHSQDDAIKIILASFLAYDLKWYLLKYIYYEFWHFWLVFKVLSYFMDFYGIAIIIMIEYNIVVIRYSIVVVKYSIVVVRYSIVVVRYNIVVVGYGVII